MRENHRETFPQTGTTLELAQSLQEHGSLLAPWRVPPAPVESQITPDLHNFSSLPPNINHKREPCQRHHVMAKTRRKRKADDREGALGVKTWCPQALSAKTVSPEERRSGPWQGDAQIRVGELQTKE